MVLSSSKKNKDNPKLKDNILSITNIDKNVFVNLIHLYNESKSKKDRIIIDKKDKNKDLLEKICKKLPKWKKEIYKNFEKEIEKEKRKQEVCFKVIEYILKNKIKSKKYGFPLNQNGGSIESVGSTMKEHLINLPGIEEMKNENENKNEMYKDLPDDVRNMILKLNAFTKNPLVAANIPDTVWELLGKMVATSMIEDIMTEGPQINRRILEYCNYYSNCKNCHIKLVQRQILESIVQQIEDSQEKKEEENDNNQQKNKNLQQNNLQGIAMQQMMPNQGIPRMHGMPRQAHNKNGQEKKKETRERQRKGEGGQGKEKEEKEEKEDNKKEEKEGTITTKKTNDKQNDK